MMGFIEPLLKEASELMDVELICNSSCFTDLDMLQNAGRSMVYDMLRCAEIAGYPEEQMVAISLIADEVGVDGFGVLEQIKQQVDVEAAIRRNRIKLLFPEGHPMLEEKYALLHKEQ